MGKSKFMVFDYDRAIKRRAILHIVDQIVESNKVLENMSKDESFLKREHIGIKTLALPSCRFSKVILYKKNGNVVGFATIKMDGSGEWSIDWLVTSGKVRSLKTLFELFCRAVEIARDGGAEYVKMELLNDTWDKANDVFALLDRGSDGNVICFNGDFAIVRVPAVGTSFGEGKNGHRNNPRYLKGEELKAYDESHIFKTPCNDCGEAYKILDNLNEKNNKLTSTNGNLYNMEDRENEDKTANTL